jgi:tetratricopeptide (TPR) repeat protein
MEAQRRNDLLATVGHALEAYQSNSMILDGAAAAAAEEMAADLAAWNANGQLVVDIEVLVSVSEYYIARYRAGDNEALEAGAPLWALLAQFAPDCLDRGLHVVVQAWRMLADNMWDQAVADVEEYLRSGDPEALDRGIEGFVAYDGTLHSVDPARGVALHNLASALTYRHDLSGEPEDLRLAIVAGREAWKLEHEPDKRLHVLTSLADDLVKLFNHDGDRGHLEAAIQFANEALELGTEHHIEIAKCWSHLGSARKSLAKVTKSADLIDEAVDALSQAVELSSDQDPNRAFRLVNLGDALVTKAMAGGSRTDWDRAVGTARSALAITSRDTARNDSSRKAPRAGECMKTLADYLRGRCERYWSESDLLESDDLLRKAMADDPAGCLVSQAINARVRADHERTTQAFDAAVEIAWRAARKTPSSTNRPLALVNLAATIAARMHAMGVDTGLDDAVQTLLVHLGPSDSWQTADPQVLGAVAVLLSGGFDSSAALDDLNLAIHAGQCAAEREPRDVGHRVNLSASLMQRYVQTEQANDLKDALEIVRAIVQEADPGDSKLFTVILGIVLAGFRATGDSRLLDEGIRIGRAVVPREGSDPNYLRCRQALGVVLSGRFRRTGMRVDIDEAIEAGAEAVRALTVWHRDDVEMLNNLAENYHIRFGEFNELSDLEEAIRLGHRVANLAQADDLNHAHYLANLSRSLRTRYEVDNDIRYLRESAEIGQSAVSEDPDSPYISATVGQTFGVLFSHTQKTPYIEKAVALGRRAVERTRDEHPEKATRLNNLATSLMYRHGKIGSEEDLIEAMTCRRLAAGLSTGSSTVRIRGAIAMGADGAEASIADLAAEGYGSAVSLMPLFVWRGLDRDLQEQRLSELDGLASRAAAWHLEANQPERAVELLDAGRSVLWGQLLDLRAEDARLATASPELHARLSEIRHELEMLNSLEPQE